MTMTMRIVTVKLSVYMLMEIDKLIRMGRYASRSEFIRRAVIELLRKEKQLLYEEMSRTIGSQTPPNKESKMIESIIHM